MIRITYLVSFDMSLPDVNDEEEQQPILEDFLCSLLERDDVKVGRMPGQQSNAGRDRGGEGPGTAQRAENVPPHPPPIYFNLKQKQRIHPSDRRRARKLDWPLCLAPAVNSNHRVFADDEYDDLDERHHDGAADQRVGPTSRPSYLRRRFASIAPASSLLTKNAKTTALVMLAASVLALVEYGTARSSSSATVDLANVSQASASDTNNYDNTNYYHHHRPAVVIGGYQARSQVPIPMEYSNFVELAEFTDAVAALRAHHARKHAMNDRQQQQQQEEQKQPHQRGVDGEHYSYPNLGNSNISMRQEDLRGYDEDDHSQNAEEKRINERVDENIINTEEANDSDGGDRGEEEAVEELKEMNNAIEKSWKEAIEKINPRMDQQPHRPFNLVKVHVPFFWHGEGY